MADDRCDLLCLDLDKAERLRLERLDGELAIRLAAQAKALSDPTRLTVAAALAATDELCVCDLAWVTERAENLVSHHARMLRSRRARHQPPRGQDGPLPLTGSGRALLDAVLAGSATPA